MATRCFSFRGFSRRASLVVLAGVFMSATMTRTAAAAGPDETAFDAATLSQMEMRADNAVVREQCYLYTEVVHGLTELAGRQIIAGQDEDAAATMQKVELVTGKIDAAARKDPKRLKNIELLLEHTSHRLADMVRATSDEQREMLQSTLRHLNAVHSGVLSMVFAH
jgi:hypothetical protein